jgi:hypothetical protein
VFPAGLKAAFQAANGEFGWTREQVPLVVSFLRHRSLAILGGELWWVRDGVPGWDLIPTRNGGFAVCPWETSRRPAEAWSNFVERCASETLSAIEQWPTQDDLPADMDGRILCNLTWVSEEEFQNLGKPQ